MLKTLIGKCRLEIAYAYFRSKKTGAKMTGGALTGMIVLYVLLYLLLAASCAALASLFFVSAKPGEMWLAYVIMGIVTLMMTAIICSLTSYAQLYLAKDNEFLLAMPIKPGLILLSRMVSVYIMGLIYISMVWIPTIIMGIIIGKVSVLTTIVAILMTFVLGFASLALTCLVGWVIAVLSTKFKNQKIVGVIVCILFIGALYFFQFKSNQIFASLADNMSSYAAIFIGPVFITIATVVGTALLMFAAYLLLSHTFVKIATTKTAGRKAKFSDTQIKTASVDKALFAKERVRFFGSINCMLNWGLGVIIMLGLAGFLFIKHDMMMERVAPLVDLIPEFSAIFASALVAAVCILESLQTSSASLISLEGKTLWQLQTLPVDPMKVIKAKINFSMVLQVVPGAVLAFALAYSLGVSDQYGIELVLFAVFFGNLSSTYGTVLNLKHINLTWTGEQTVIKQGMPVVTILFGGWLVGIVLGAAVFFACKIMSAAIAIAVLMIVCALLTNCCNRWLRTKGVELFRYA